MDTSAYVKRMELAIVNANIAMEKLRNENKTLQERVSELEKQLREATKKTDGVKLTSDLNSQPMTARPASTFAKSIMSKATPLPRSAPVAPAAALTSTVPINSHKKSTPVTTSTNSKDESSKHQSTAPVSTPISPEEEALSADIDDVLNASDFSLSSDDVDDNMSVESNSTNDSNIEEASHQTPHAPASTSSAPSTIASTTAPTLLRPPAPVKASTKRLGWTNLKAKKLSDILPQLALDNVHSAVRLLLTHPALDVSKEILKYVRNQAILHCAKASQAGALISPQMNTFVQLMTTFFTSLVWNTSASYPLTRVAVLKAVKRRFLHLMRYGAKVEPLPLSRLFLGEKAIGMRHAYSSKARVAAKVGVTLTQPSSHSVDSSEEIPNCTTQQDVEQDVDALLDDILGSSDATTDNSETGNEEEEADSNQCESSKLLPAGIIEAMACLRVVSETDLLHETTCEVAVQLLGLSTAFMMSTSHFSSLECVVTVVTCIISDHIETLRPWSDTLTLILSGLAENIYRFRAVHNEACDNLQRIVETCSSRFNNNISQHCFDLKELPKMLPFGDGSSQLPLQSFTMSKRRRQTAENHSPVLHDIHQVLICYRYGFWEVLTCGVSCAALDVLGVHGVTEIANAFLSDSAITWSLHCSEAPKLGDNISTLPGFEVSLLPRFENMWSRTLSNLNDERDVVELARTLFTFMRVLVCLVEQDMRCDSLRYWPIAGDVQLEVKLEQLISSGRQLLATINVPFPKPIDLSSEAATTLLSTSVSPSTVATAIALLNSCRTILVLPGQSESLLPSQIEDINQLIFDISAHLAPVVVECLLFYVSCSVRSCIRAVAALMQTKATFISGFSRLLHHCCRLEEIICVGTNMHSWIVSLPIPYCGYRSDTYIDIVKSLRFASQGLPLEIGTYLHRMSHGHIVSLVINLDKRHDRWRRFLSMCEKHAVIALRQDAVDGRSPDLAIDATVVGTHWDSTLNSKYDGSCFANTAIPMTPSERACAASHVEAWKFTITVLSGHNDIYDYFLRHAMDEKQDYMLIFEDDAIICRLHEKPFTSRMRQVRKALPNDFDICYLGYAAPKRVLAKPKKIKNLLFKPEYLWQLHGYMLSLSGAKKLLSYLPVNQPVDNFIAHLLCEDKINGYAMLPAEQFVKQETYSAARKKKDSNINHSARLK